MNPFQQWRQSAAQNSGMLALVFLGSLAASCSGPPSGQPAAVGGERVGLDAATALVRAQVLEDHPAFDPSAQIFLVERTSDELWSRMGLQLFQITNGDGQLTKSEASVYDTPDAYLVFDGKAQFLCLGIGGFGIQSTCVTDLDGDGQPELTYSYSWGSGVHRSLVGVAQLDKGTLEVEEAPLAFTGDLFVRKETDSSVVVEIGDFGWEFGSWTPTAQLGKLALEGQQGELKPHIELAPLSDENAKLIW